MSYDLTLFELREAADPAKAWEELMRLDELRAADLDGWMKQTLPPPIRARMQELADHLRSHRPNWQQFEPASPLPWIELNDEDLQVQICIHESMLSITVPYFRHEAHEMLQCVGDAIRTVHAFTGYVAYDPQLGRLVSEADLKDVLAQYRTLSLPGTSGNLPRPTGLKKPWWKLWIVLLCWVAQVESFPACAFVR